MIHVLALTLVLQAGIADDADYQKAQALYADLEYEQSLKAFTKILERSDLSNPDRAQVLLWVALCQAGTGDLKGAQLSFTEAVEYDPYAGLPQQSAPKVTRMYEEAQARALKAHKEKEAAAQAEAEATAQAEAEAEATAQPEPEVAEQGSGRGLSVLFLGGASAAALGAATLVGGAVFSGLAYSDLGTAVDREQFQDDANAALEAATFNNMLAMICYGTGATLWAAGAVMATVDVIAGE